MYGPAAGISFMSQDAVALEAAQTVHDDLAIAGNSVSVGGTVDGELFAAGDSVTCSGKTSASAWLAGRNVSSTGPVGGSLRVGAQSASITGHVGKDAMIACASLSLPADASVGRDLAIATSDASILSPVGRNLLLAAENGTLGSTVGGSAVVKANRLTLLPGAVIRGNLDFTGQTLDVQPGAKVLGKITKHLASPKERKKGGFKPTQALLLSIALIIFGAVLTGIAPRFVGAASGKIRESFGSTLGWGVLIAAIGVVAILLALGLTITVILAPVTLSFLMLYGIAVYASVIFVGAALGKTIFGWFRKQGDSVILNMLVGTVVLCIVCSIPYIGWLVWLLSAALGLGGLVAWLRTRGLGEQAVATTASPPPLPEV